MRDRDSFGMAGRARGVENVAKRIGRRRALLVAERRPARRRNLLPLPIEKESRDRAVGEPVGQPEMGDDERCGRVEKHVANALGRVICVERNIGRARLHQRHERGVRLRATVQQHGDPIAGFDAPCDEESRHLISPGVELGEGNIRASTAIAARSANRRQASSMTSSSRSPCRQHRAEASLRIESARAPSPRQRSGDARVRGAFECNRRGGLGPVCRRIRHRFNLSSSKLALSPLDAIRQHVKAAQAP